MSSDTTPAVHRPEIGAHAEAAMRAVRVLVAVLAVVVLGAYRPLAGDSQWLSLATSLAGIVVGAVAVNAVSVRIGRRDFWTGVLQAIDVAGAIAIAVLLDGPLGQQSWMVLIIPVVNAAVRWGAMAVALSWFGAGLGYLAAIHLGLASAAGDASTIVRVPGTLLAVAIAVGVLARWMREGWELQNELTATVAARERRLAAIESVIPALRGLASDAALEVCAGQVLELGFAAATVDWSDGRAPSIVVGDGSLVADRADAPEPSDEEPAVTVWTEAGRVRAHSVAVVESQSKAIVTAWSRTPIDEDRAFALVTLVAHTSAALETSNLLNRLRESADHDPLTGLANRRSLDRLLREHALARGRLSVAFVDLDDFKAVNDQFGHEVGDKVLIALGERLKAVTGPYGSVARYGGDEFVVVLPGVALEEAELFAAAALEAVSEPLAFGPAVARVGMSIGVASASTPTSEIALMRAADEAAYKAKAAGKNTFCAIDVDTGAVRHPADAGVRTDDVV